MAAGSCYICMQNDSGQNDIQHDHMGHCRTGIVPEPSPNVLPWCSCVHCVLLRSLSNIAYKCQREGSSIFDFTSYSIALILSTPKPAILFSNIKTRNPTKIQSICRQLAATFQAYVAAI